MDYLRICPRDVSGSEISIQSSECLSIQSAIPNPLLRLSSFERLIDKLVNLLDDLVRLPHLLVDDFPERTFKILDFMPQRTEFVILQSPDFIHLVYDELTVGMADHASTRELGTQIEPFDERAVLGAVTGRGPNTLFVRVQFIAVRVTDENTNCPGARIS
jgi:hypothetical protein